MKPFLSKNKILGTTTTETRWKYLKFGRVVRVDTSKMIMDIEWLFDNGGRSEVPIASPYFAGNSFLGAVPDVGAIGVFGWFNFDNYTAAPLPLAYMPNGVIAGRNYVAIKEYSDGLGVGYEEPFRYKLRNLRPGDIYASHKSGSDLLINKDVLFSNSSLSEFWMRSSDQTILMNSVNRFESTDGTIEKTGLVYRNAWQSAVGGNPKDLANEAQNTIKEDQQEDVISDGRHVYIVTRGGGSPDDGHHPFIEMRTEIHEFGDGILDIHDEMFGTDGEEPEDGHNPPLIEFVHGTVVGNDSSDPKRYAKVLKAVIFSSPLAEDGIFHLTPIDGGALSPLEEGSSLAAGYYHRVGQNYHHTVSKEGTIALAVGRTGTGHSLGSGYSAEYLYQGSIKAAVGANFARNRSVEASLEGGIDLRVGAETDNINKGTRARSLSVRAEGAINWVIANPDSNGDAWSTTMRGNEFKIVEGNSRRELSGNEVSVIQGMIDEYVLGKKSVKVVEDYALSVGGNINMLTSSKMELQIGQGRKEKINTGGDELVINQGDKITTLQVGSWKTTVVAGNHEQKVEVGNWLTQVTLGNANIKTTTGNISLEAIAGNISAKTTAGTATMEATLPVTVKSDIKASITAPTVDLGVVATGGVITDTTHLDYIVGIPLQSSKTVKASN